MNGIIRNIRKRSLPQNSLISIIDCMAAWEYSSHGQRWTFSSTIPKIKNFFIFACISSTVHFVLLPKFLVFI